VLLLQAIAEGKPEAMEAVFHRFHSSLSSLESADGHESIATDGSTFPFFSKLSKTHRLQLDRKYHQPYCCDPSKEDKA